MILFWPICTSLGRRIFMMQWLTYLSATYDLVKTSLNDVMPGSDGPDNWKILKKSQLGVDFGRCGQMVGLSVIEEDSLSWVRQLWWEVGVRPWCCEVGIWPGSWGFEIGPWKTIVEFLPLGHRVGFQPLKDVVSIVWYERLLRIVSLSSCRRTELRSL